MKSKSNLLLCFCKKAYRPIRCVKEFICSIEKLGFITKTYLL